MPKSYGFTLIELLVVIAIMGLVGTYALSNYRSFGEDQKLKNDALDVQNLLRLAQSNATTGLMCQSLPALNWRVEFTSTSRLDLKCQNLSGTSGSIKHTSPSATTTNYSYTAGACTDAPTYASFAPLYGTMTSNCSPNSITITVTDSRNITKSVIIEQGGRIYAQ